MTIEDTPMVDLARAYDEAGLTVVPPKQDGTKRPYPGSWDQFQCDRPTPKQIKEWYSHNLTGIGTVCGAVSGNLELFEFDWYDTYVAFGELAVATGHGQLIDRIKNGYTERTPGGGIHWYYRCDTIAGNTKLARKPDPTPQNPLGVKVLIETRGEGGYAVMAPSHGSVHQTGKPYEVVCGDVTGIVTITPQEREALWELARTFDEMPQQAAYTGSQRTADGDRPGDLYNAAATWRDVLGPHGWKLVYRRGETGYWRRPGKNIGISATTNHTGNDTLIVFSTSTPFETAPASYSKFAAYAVLNHGGDYAAAGRTLWQEGFREEGGTHAEYDGTYVDPETGEIHEDGPQPIDWPTFWATDYLAEDWLLEPVLPRGRSVSLYAGAKSGKSLLTLDMIARLVTGQPVLDRIDPTPVTVVYLDLEMTEADLRERLEDLGYGAAHDLSHLHYYLLPSLPPLDTPAGGEALRKIVARHSAELVIIDTTSRVISGEENSADTMRAFYAMAVLPLKAAGVTVLRLDHSGKDLSRGQRGTSAKADDVDLVWELSPIDGGVRLRATHRRQAWVPEIVNLKRLDDPLRHERGDDAWPAGTIDMVNALDDLGLPWNASRKAARETLKSANRTATNDVLAAAIRWRKKRGQPVGQGFVDWTGQRNGQPVRNGDVEPTDSPSDSVGQQDARTTDNCPPLKVDSVRLDPPPTIRDEEPEEENWWKR